MLRDVGMTVFSMSLCMTLGGCILIFAKWYCMFDMAVYIITTQILSLFLSMFGFSAMLHIIGPDHNPCFYTDATYCPEPDNEPI